MCLEQVKRGRVLGRVILGRGMAGRSAGGLVSGVSKASNEGYWGRCRGDGHLNHSGCPLTRFFFQPLLLVYLMFHFPPSRF